MDITIIGSGAIGGTLGAHMIRAGHDITLCDADEAHVAAIREHGLIIEGPVNEFTVAAHAITPGELPDRVDHAIVAVKSLHTRAAAELLRNRLAPDGYVLTVQNGLTADILVEAVGRDRVISSFVNFGADVMAPGRIMQGNVGTFRVGELDGGRITPRVRDLAEALPYAKPTDNVLGFLWGKEAYGAMLWAGAVSDLTIVEHLEDPRYRPVMIAIAREVLAQAPVRVESFDGFDPDDLEGPSTGWPSSTAPAPRSTAASTATSWCASARPRSTKCCATSTARSSTRSPDHPRHRRGQAGQRAREPRRASGLRRRAAGRLTHLVRIPATLGGVGVDSRSQRRCWCGRS